MSLTRRVLLGCAAVALVLFVADVVLAGTFRSYLVSRVDEGLVRAASEMADVGDGHFGPGPGGRGPGGPPFSALYVGVAGVDGSGLQRVDLPFGDDGATPALDAETLVDQAAPAGEPPEVFSAEGTGDSRWRAVAVPRDDQLVVVAASLGEVGAVYDRVVLVLALATAAVLATLAVVATWVLRQGVRPLSAMTATAGAIAAGDLSERVDETDERTEAGRLGRALNAMLARIEEAFAERTASEQRLRRFVADASHELRTPLTSIRGYADLYRHGALSDPGELDGAMRRVEMEATRMGGLVDDLLLLARLDQGRPLEREPVRLDAVVGDAVRDARAVEPERPVEADVAPVTIVGDEGRLRQVVGNLLTNVRVHTPAATPVRVTLSGDGGDAVLEVADEGPGIPADVVARVFERFVRADPSRTRASGGSGLGLSIVAGVVAAHGGTVDVASEPGAGARFTVRLPLAVSVPPAPDVVVERG